MAAMQMIAKWGLLFFHAPVAQQLPRKGPQPGELAHLTVESVNLPDLAEEVYHFGRGLSDIVDRAELRLRRLEEKSGGAGVPKEAAPFISDAKRITTSMKRQLEQLQQMSRDLRDPEFLKTRDLLNGKIEVPNFGRELLGSSSGRWARAAEAWEPILDVILRRAEYRTDYRRMERALETRLEHAALK